MANPSKISLVFVLCFLADLVEGFDLLAARRARSDGAFATAPGAG